MIQLEVATFAPLAIASTRFAAGTPAAAAYCELGEVLLWATQPIECAGALAVAAACEALRARRKALQLAEGAVVWSWPGWALTEQCALLWSSADIFGVGAAYGWSCPRGKAA